MHDQATQVVIDGPLPISIQDSYDKLYNMMWGPTFGKNTIDDLIGAIVLKIQDHDPIVSYIMLFS